ncbi:hypothetical protein ASPTUDRAFT_302767 [Aspergillus tubingensis CBS 134.48]|uniref:Uncharacterized protein n=1 Tax=Aspergillus tubingensis (strain CBS 134.48) TaxID=767770 RepID=A0A1L9NPY1_ASPTC|nr:hypothetical protein ASPTUDRAFT_302767 [Aspergillus tubingensis CBS 134.48]
MVGQQTSERLVFSVYMGAYRDPSAIGPSLLYNMRWASVLLGFQWPKIVGGPFHVTYKHIVTHQILHSLMTIIYLLCLEVCICADTLRRKRGEEWDAKYANMPEISEILGELVRGRDAPPAWTASLAASPIVLNRVNRQLIAISLSG